MNELPAEIPRLIQALMRLRVVFQGTPDVELMDSDVAELAGLDEDECRILLAVLQQTGAIERPRRRVFVCRRSSWWTAARARSKPPLAFRPPLPGHDVEHRHDKGSSDDRPHDGESLAVHMKHERL
jgi:hypothetical protein